MIYTILVHIQNDASIENKFSVGIERLTKQITHQRTDC